MQPPQATKPQIFVLIARIEAKLERIWHVKSVTVVDTVHKNVCRLMRTIKNIVGPSVACKSLNVRNS